MRSLVDSLDKQFAGSRARSIRLLERISDSDLYRMPRELPNSMAMFSCGEYLLRSAAAVEQTAGGITTRLWDDPFEWTLPEKLASVSDVIGYMDEVELARQRAFAFLVSDSDLTKSIPAPEELKSIFDLLVSTLGRSDHFQGRAFAVFQMLSDEKLPRL